jgi:hypothetical protein
LNELGRIVLKRDIYKILANGLSGLQTLPSMVGLSKNETCRAVVLHDANRTSARFQS